MWNKHFTWPQIAIVQYFVFAGSSALSIQKISGRQDIFWTIIFLIVGTVHFITEEHGHPLQISADKWQQIHRKIIFGVQTLIALAPWGPRDCTYMCFVLGIGFILSIFKVKQIKMAQQALTIINLNWLFMIQFVLEKGVTYKLDKRSFADIRLKWYQLKKALIILLEVYQLWCIRCYSRFPMNIRWTPIIVGIIAQIMAMVYVTVSIAKTSVSNNAIISQLEEHNIAVSFKVANKCPTCLKYISALDMESSFGE